MLEVKSPQIIVALYVGQVLNVNALEEACQFDKTHLMDPNFKLPKVEVEWTCRLWVTMVLHILQEMEDENIKLMIELSGERRESAAKLLPYVLGRLSIRHIHESCWLQKIEGTLRILPLPLLTEIWKTNTPIYTIAPTGWTKKPEPELIPLRATTVTARALHMSGLHPLEGLHPMTCLGVHPPTRISPRAAIQRIGGRSAEQRLGQAKPIAQFMEAECNPTY